MLEQEQSLACLFSFLAGNFVSSDTLLRFGWFVGIAKEINQGLPENCICKDVYDDRFIQDNRAAFEKKMLSILTGYLESLSGDELLGFSPVLALIKMKRQSVMKEIFLPFDVTQMQPDDTEDWEVLKTPLGKSSYVLFLSLCASLTAQSVLLRDLNCLSRVFTGHKTQVFDSSFCSDLEKVCLNVSEDVFTQNKVQSISNLLLAVATIKPENAGKVHLALQVLPNKNPYARLIKAGIEELFFLGAHYDKERFAADVALYICSDSVDSLLSRVDYVVPEAFLRLKSLFS